MGSNNGALEVAGERMLFEREKLAGLSPEAYLAAKGTFLALLITAQAVWMVLFVHWVCSFPGDMFGQVALLWLADAALTSVCLGFSSLARTASQASLVSVYFVGFQLPLSGAVLALPDAIAQVTRPFIAAYWSWSGTIQTLRDTRFYDLILTITKPVSRPCPRVMVFSWPKSRSVVPSLTLAAAAVFGIDSMLCPLR